MEFHASISVSASVASVNQALKFSHTAKNMQNFKISHKKQKKDKL